MTTLAIPPWAGRVHRGALAAALALCLGAATAVTSAQSAFPSPEAAMAAFGEAVLAPDENALKALLGNDFRDLIPPIGDELRARFITAWGEKHVIEPGDGKTAHIAVGTDGWTLPLPIVKTAKGWQFDTQAGAIEIRIRRVGRNELATIQTMLAVYDAEREYALTTHDDNTVLVYAAKLESSPGKHDGLYWPTGPGEAPSPLGPAFPAVAHAKATETDGYHGYRFKLLTAQGPHAPGGAYDYMVNGKLFGGFGVMAWPVRYQDTGVMSFIVNHDGQVYERDLGPRSADKAAATKFFDPGTGWRKVSP